MINPQFHFLIVELTDKWSHYPGLHMSGSHFYAETSNGDECLDLCYRNPVCEAIDFNTDTGMCWFHVKKNRCDTLKPSDTMYHAKKKYTCGKYVCIKYSKEVLDYTFFLCLHNIFIHF